MEHGPHGGLNFRVKNTIMKLNDILAKVVKGDALTDEERNFLSSYDEQKSLDGAASAARRKAETERDNFKAKVDELSAALEDAKKTGDNSNNTIAKLQKDVADLIKANKESAAKIAAQARTDAIRKAVGDAKISCAKGVSSSLFEAAIKGAFEGVDMANGDVVKAALDKFKADNPAIIAAQGIGGAGVQGNPGEPATAFTGPNPFAKKTFNLTRGMQLIKNDPATAKALQAEAAKETE